MLAPWKKSHDQHRMLKSRDIILPTKVCLVKAMVFLVVMYGCECFPSGSDGKVSAWNTGDPGLTPGLGRSPGEGNGNPLKYSCLENSMD